LLEDVFFTHGFFYLWLIRKRIYFEGFEEKTCT